MTNLVEKGFVKVKGFVWILNETKMLTSQFSLAGRIIQIKTANKALDSDG